METINEELKRQVRYLSKKLNIKGYAEKKSS